MNNKATTSHQPLFIKKGFTLLELLVAISIIGILISMGTVYYSSAQKKSRDAKRKSDLKEIRTALRMYYNDYQSYPSNNSNHQIVGCGTTFSWGSEFSCGSTVYMSELPEDPDSSKRYHYLRGSDGDSSNTDAFRLYACLENESDPDLDSSDRCSSSDAYSYTIFQD